MGCLSRKNGKVQGIMEVEDGPPCVGSEGKREELQKGTMNSRDSVTYKVENGKTPLKTCS